MTASELAAQARAFELAGDDSRAGEAYRRALASDPERCDLRASYAKLLLAHGHDSEAAQELGLVVHATPENSEARLLLAQALTGTDRAAEAREHLEAAIQDPAAAASGNGMLGYWFQARGRFSESKACFEAAIQADPTQSLAYYGWAQSNRFGSDSVSIIESAERHASREDLPIHERMVFRYVLGKGYSDLQEYEKSIGAFDLANGDAFKVNLGGKPFDRKSYAQTIDGTISTFSNDLLKKSRGIGLSSRLPIFVVGMMRSGTTLVEQILSSHPDAAPAGEVDFWLDEGPSAVDLTKKKLDGKRLGALASAYERHLRSLSQGKPHVIDKMPQNFQMLGQIHLAFPNAPIVHIRRNPLDNCISIYTTAYQQSPAFAHDRESIVFAYRQYQRLVAHWRRVLPPNRFLEIDYETLVADPQTSVRKLLSFCGLPWNEACLSPERNDRLVTTPSLWQVRQPVNRGAIDRWRVYEPWLGAFRQLLD